jgi:branched-chain amino acid transport system substrate-binding protein
MNFRSLLGSAAAAVTIAFSAPASAQYSGNVIRIAVLDDLSGVLSDYSGLGSVEAIKLAIADMGGSVKGTKVELLSFDHQNKPDLAATKAREYMDQDGADMVLVLGNSAAALAVARVAAEKRRVFMSNSGSIRLTNEECTPYTVRVGVDTVVWSRGTANAVLHHGGKKWFWLSVNNAFGAGLEADASAVIKANGGSIVGSVKNPLNTPDFSSYMLQAEASNADILALANAGHDLTNAIKAANEFGVTKKMKMVSWLFVTDVHALGLPLTQNMYMADAWYWDQDDQSRAWSKRFFDQMKRMPTSQQAASYSAAYEFLAAAKAAGSDDADKVLSAMRAKPLNDMYLRNGTLRPDGSVSRDVYLYQVKTPAESKAPWDYMKVVERIPGDKVFLSQAESKCATWK